MRRINIACASWTYSVPSFFPMKKWKRFYKVPLFFKKAQKSRSGREITLKCKYQFSVRTWKMRRKRERWGYSSTTQANRWSLQRLICEEFQVPFSRSKEQTLRSPSNHKAGHKLEIIKPKKDEPEMEFKASPNSKNSRWAGPDGDSILWHRTKGSAQTILHFLLLR